MRNAFIGALAILITWRTSTLVQAQTKPDEAPPTLDGAAFLTSPGKQWKLVWHDEFDGQSLDDSKWSIGLPWGGTDGTGRHHNDQYASYIVDHDIELADGHLKLLTRREDVTDKKGRVFHFTEGLITTARSFRHRYGYWEARVKLPVEAGPGLWPAFWTLAEGWPPEMDICEIWTGNNRSHQGLYYQPREGGRQKWDDVTTHSPLPTGWTTYGMEWGSGYQIYNIDGHVTHRGYGDDVTGEKHYILLNSGVESEKPPPPTTVFPNILAVDYVRVYERPDVAIVHNGDFEQDDPRSWGRSGYVVQVDYGAHGGTHALRIDGGPSVSEQKLYALHPKATYVLSGWVRVLSKAKGAGEARIGVKSYGGDEKFAATTRGDYERLEVAFTAGADATTAIVYCSLPGKEGAALFDDMTLQAK